MILGRKALQPEQNIIKMNDMLLEGVQFLCFYSSLERLPIKGFNKMVKTMSKEKITNEYKNII